MIHATASVPTLRLAPGAGTAPGTLDPGQLPARGPLVSCLMVTRGRRHPAAHAIACFRSQTYTNRELVIVCDQPDAEIARLAADLDDSAIRYVEIAPATLGELRNASVAHAHGELLCQWDDDDLYPADRIALMAGALADADAAFLQRWTIWWPARAILAISGRRAWEGTMLARRGVLPVYSALAIDEDRPAIERLAALHPVVLVDRPQAYCYVVHGANSYDAQHFETMLGWATARVAPADYARELDALGTTIPVAAYAERLAAMA